MLTVFWDERGVILEHYMTRGNTVTSAMYEDLLKNRLRPAINSKWRGILSTGVLLQHDNARPHTAFSTFATIQDLSFESLPHPPYSQELFPSGLHIFGPLKEAMRRSPSGLTKRCSRLCMNGCALRQKNFFCMDAPQKRWNTFMKGNGDCTEKLSHCVPLVFNKLRDKKYLRITFGSTSKYYVFNHHLKLGSTYVKPHMHNNTRSYTKIRGIYSTGPNWLPYALSPLDVARSKLCESVCQQLSSWEDVL